LNDSDDARQEFLALRATAGSALLATLAQNSTPAASYAPCVWFEGDCYLYLSQLASHTGNLLRNSKISLLLIESEARTANPFARRRISLHGSVQAIARDDQCFVTVLAEFRQQFGKVMDVIEPLPDFRLFRVVAESGRFIRGFGQAYELTGNKLDQLRHVDPRR
jgi:putative heme iron utilization protein